MAIVLKNKNIEVDVKLEHQKKHVDKIITWTKNNIKYKSYINCICLSHIQQKFQAIKTD